MEIDRILIYYDSVSVVKYQKLETNKYEKSEDKELFNNQIRIFNSKDSIQSTRPTYRNSIETYVIRFHIAEAVCNREQ